VGDADIVVHVPRLIAFDLDGTLVDSVRDLADSANELIVELGGVALREDAISDMVGGGAALLVRRALAAAGVEHPPSAVTRFLEIYDTRLLNHTRLYDGIADVVHLARPHAHLAVLTNKPLGPSERLLEAFELRQLFDDVIGGDGPYARKPDPGGLLALMASAGVTGERTLLVGDSEVDYETARRADARSCLVSYGFGFRKFPRERLGDHDWVVDDAAGLAAAIERFVGLSTGSGCL
jgi:phosphoglycolate phosphatase